MKWGILLLAVTLTAHATPYTCYQRAAAWSEATAMRNAGVPWRQTVRAVRAFKSGYSASGNRAWVRYLYSDPRLAGVPSRVMFRVALDLCLKGR